MLSLTAALIGFAPALQPLALRSPARSSAALGHPMMYGAMASKKMDAREEGGPPSFVQTEMRSAAMALHTMQQAPKEGKAPQKKVEQTPVQEWQPGRAEYLQFLVDSREVYRTLEDIVSRTPALAPFRESGLERSEALSRDIAWFTEQGVAEPPVAEQGATYVKMLTEMADANEIEAFVCHFYNTYFAHTAGGRMIGKKMSNLLLEGRTLDFYRCRIHRSAAAPTVLRPALCRVAWRRRGSVGPPPPPFPSLPPPCLLPRRPALSKASQPSVSVSRLRAARSWDGDVDKVLLPALRLRIDELVPQNGGLDHEKSPPAARRRTRMSRSLHPCLSARASRPPAPPHARFPTRASRPPAQRTPTLRCPPPSPPRPSPLAPLAPSPPPSPPPPRAHPMLSRALRIPPPPTRLPCHRPLLRPLRLPRQVDTWTREQKDACLAQTADSFKFGGALLQHISRPAPARA